MRKSYLPQSEILNFSGAEIFNVKGTILEKLELFSPVLALKQAVY
tara:strand:- start:349 stop:483 length:135 start_codon:yes stop_codon:yes gene_type:complete